jgi:hypothetical protein
LIIRIANKQNNFSIDPLLEAQKLLRSTHYYQHQFAVVSSMQERQSDAEFLYTLKLCYESGLDRTASYVEQLQKKIFESIPSGESLQRLGTWIYLSGQYYAMHDIPREAIKFNDYARLKIMNCLTNNFLQLVPKSDAQVYSFGLFLGRNIQFVPRDLSNPFLPKHIYEYMKSQRYFEIGLGQGVGDSFSSLEIDVQDQILRRVHIDFEFTRGFAERLGHDFPSLSEEDQREILKKLKSGMAFRRWFGEGLGRVFRYLTAERQKEIFELLKKKVHFADGVGIGLGYTILYIDKESQRQIFDKAEKNSELTRGLGYGIAHNYPKN